MLLSRRKEVVFTDGLLKAGEKLLNGSPGRLFIEILKTIAKLVYNWVIGTNNDKAMEKFSNRMLTETQFQEHQEEYTVLLD